MRLQFIMLILLPSFLAAQVKPKSNKPTTKAISLPGLEYIDVLQQQDRLGSMIDLHLFHHKIGNEPVSTTSYADTVNALNPKNRMTSDEFLIKNKLSIVKYLENIKSFGNSESSIYNNPQFPSIGFAKYNGQVCFYQIGVAYESFLNSARLASEERYKKVAKELLIPSLKNFQPILDISVSYYLLAATYLSYDFTEEYHLNAHSEMVAIIIPKSLLQDFLKLNITDEQLIKQSSFFTHTDEMNARDLKRVTIN